VARCHRSGLSVNTWTCNDPVRLVELAELGVDGVCTDVPDVALTALGRTEASADPMWPAR
jgi:glycerophosphoryl diester phosphodiesterase